VQGVPGDQQHGERRLLRPAGGDLLSDPVRARRGYDSTLRRERAAATRQRIITAGSELLHGSSVRDWRALTVRAVAERAGVNERTVYRHFVNEQGLHDAVMHRLEQEAGVDLVGLELEGIAGVATRILEHVSSFPLESRAPTDPTLVDANQRQRQALLLAVAARSATWSPADRTIAAAMLDVLWSVATYERLVVGWELERDQAIQAITWVIGLVTDAVGQGRRPG
jgi:AcrR family transcriptional regulator